MLPAKYEIKTEKSLQNALDNNSCSSNFKHDNSDDRASISIIEKSIKFANKKRAVLKPLPFYYFQKNLHRGLDLLPLGFFPSPHI